MESLRVAAVSLNSELGKRVETLRRIEQFCEQAAAERAELAVFPELIVHGQTEQIRDEMIVADLDASLLAAARSHPNYTLRTRRPELFGELVRDQVVC